MPTITKKDLVHRLAAQLQLLPHEAERIVGLIFDEMKQAIRRGVETTERLRAFSRQSPEERVETVDIDHVAAEAIALCRPRLRSSEESATISLREELGGPPSVIARSGDFVAALVNLIVNAIDALPRRGKIVVSTGALDDGGWVRVADNELLCTREHRIRAVPMWQVGLEETEGQG